jgi:inhibitor of cysteine peptidase
MFRIFCCVAVAHGLLVAGGCANHPAGAPAALDGTSNGGRVTLSAGATLTIRLVSNPTTGYRWQPAAATDAAVLRQVSNTYAPNTSSPGLVGVGGIETWTYQAQAAGTTTIRLHYVRPWEKPPSPAQTYVLTVTVEGRRGV